ncbi:uncharacterized protein LOC134823432 [Bolinopsis microptera]|uniref:uncharacterized protein LOC134823432 n=1 Tax=Bolinopsis microptera TaxID=2820187 RepID=UPI003079B344
MTKMMRSLVLTLSVVIYLSTAIPMYEAEERVVSLVKRGDSYIEDGLYDCHAKKSVMKASDLHEAAEERIKEVFRKKRAAVDDGIKVLSSRTSQVVQMKQKVNNYTARHAAATYCANKSKFLSKGIAKEVGCADQTSGTTLHILCLYRVEF